MCMGGEWRGGGAGGGGAGGEALKSYLKNAKKLRFPPRILKLSLPQTVRDINVPAVQ